MRKLIHLIGRQLAVAVAVSTFEAFGELGTLRMNGEREGCADDGEKMDGGEFHESYI